MYQHVLFRIYWWSIAREKHMYVCDILIVDVVFNSSLFWTVDNKHN